jgi:hypothetical protein
VTTVISEHVTREDLQPILDQHTGNRAFEQALRSAADGKELVRVLGRYIHFNSVFGAGVANLAGEVAVRHDLFQDHEEPITFLADRSAEVAAAIFFAAIDEFGDRTTPRHATHRALATATLKATGNFFGYDVSSLEEIIRPNAVTESAIEKVCQGYLLNQTCEENALFQAMGFHAGSEILADEEFRLLDGILREKHPKLVDYLEKSEIEMGGKRHPTYAWIDIHTSVEADHFQFAVKAANRALEYYAGPGTRERAKELIIRGFQDFSVLQTEFMQGFMA